MRLRIYSQTPDGERHTVEVDVLGDIIRICDDHGRIVTSDPWSKTQHGPMMCASNTVQPRYSA